MDKNLFDPSVNQQYQTSEMKKAIRDAYTKNKDLKLVALGKFFTQAVFRAIQKDLNAGWKYQDIPDQELYEIHKNHTISQNIATFAKAITGKQPLSHPPRQFKHRSFTLMHDEKPEPSGVLAFLFLDDWDPRWGGEFVLYKNGQALARFTPQANTLLLVERKKGVHSFIRYVNHHAKKKAFRILSA